MLGVPMVAVVTGEGGSGGALGIACGSRVLILEHAVYSVIPPEGAIRSCGAARARRPRRPRRMKITAQDLLGMKIVDRIIPEPPGGAHSDPEAAHQVGRRRHRGGAEGAGRPQPRRDPQAARRTLLRHRPRSGLQ